MPLYYIRQILCLNFAHAISKSFLVPPLTSDISVLSILHVNLPGAAPVEPGGYETKSVSLVNS